MNPIIKYCLVAICLSMPAYLFSQNFISEAKVWRIGVKTDYEPCCRYSNAAFRFHGDSVINDTTYKKLYESDDEFLTNWYLSGLWRGNNDSIYQLDSNTGKANLVYDFNLMEGDSFKVDKYRVLYVDSVRLKKWGNRMRKHWYLSAPGFEQWGETVWIEGVGQLGLFTRSTESGITGAFCRLLCYSENGQLVYQNPEYNSCYLNELSAQSFVSTDKLWSTMKGPVSGCSSFYCSSYFTKFVGDTVIGGTHYLKVMRSEDQQMQKWTIEGFIREDNAQKVFYRDKHASDACLLYDFGCEVGDTLQLNCGCNKSGYLVDSIKTIIADDIPRKYFYLTYLDMKTQEIWIEGIGSTMGVLNAGGWGHCLTGGGMGEALLCFFEGGIKRYQSAEFPNFCFLSKDIIDGTDPVKAVSEFKVYPNPVSGELIIQPNSGVDESYSLELFTAKGELVKTECLDAGMNVYRLDVSEFKSGTYILHLISDSGKYEDHKVIIKK